MGIYSAQDIEELQAKIREAVMEADPGKALEYLLAALPAGRAKHNQVLLLKSRHTEILHFIISNTLSPEQVNILKNNLTEDTLLFNNHLCLADFAPAPAQRPELKPGHLLYQIPTSMLTGKTYDCLIRIAHELDQVLRGMAREEDIVVEEIALAEVMAVEILDPESDGVPAFNITLLSDGEQLVDEYSYTEWVFNVRPLREGTLQLILKISVLLTVNGKERTKNVILRRPVTVAAAAAAAEVPVAMRRLVVPLAEKEESSASYPDEVVSPPVIAPPTALPGGDVFAPTVPPLATARPRPNPPPPVPAPAPARPKSNRRSYLSVAATVLLLVLAGFWLIQPGESYQEGIDDPTRTDNKDSLELRDNQFPTDTSGVNGTPPDSL